MGAMYELRTLEIVTRIQVVDANREHPPFTLEASALPNAKDIISVIEGLENVIEAERLDYSMIRAMRASLEPGFARIDPPNAAPDLLFQVALGTEVDLGAASKLFFESISFPEFGSLPISWKGITPVLAGPCIAALMWGGSNPVVVLFAAAGAILVVRLLYPIVASVGDTIAERIQKLPPRE